MVCMYVEPCQYLSSCVQIPIGIILPVRIKIDVSFYHVSYGKSHSSCGPLIDGLLIERY